MEDSVNTRYVLLSAALATSLLSCGAFVRADTLELKDGTVMSNCFVRDEAVHYLV
jgi:hypothetical protein